MEYYFSYETLSRGESRGKGTTVFEASDLSDAFSKGAKMLEQIARPDRLSPDVEERVTVGNMVYFPDPAA
ncbi:MAG: hypothetical protein HYT34_02330 [Candidatus Ryanbacteria bacterium]|nr:hypothetical protein [Candidatus Ryanbacteria bacterium]